MQGGRTTALDKILAVLIAAAYLGMVAYVIVNVARRASAEMALVRARQRKGRGPAQLGVLVGRLLPMLWRLR